VPRVEQDFDVYSNSVEIIQIAVTDTNGIPVDLTTFDDLCWILTRSGVEVQRYTTVSPEMTIVDVDATNDGIRLTLPITLTGTLSCGRLYDHQLWGTFNAVPRPVSVGKITVLRGDGC